MLQCRSCGHKDLKPILDFGETPLSDNLLTEEDLDKPEFMEKLELVFCPECSLVQITESVEPKILFGDDYPYFSSVNKTLLNHSKENVEDLIASRKLGKDSLAVELASNDGYLLQYFKQNGVPVLGIDPAKGPVEEALKKGVDTIHDFFTTELAEKLKAEGKTADVILANNVLAHVRDTNGFVAGIATMLKEDGVAVIEVPYLVDLVEHCEFDTIYHQHLLYFSITALDNLFRRHGLFLNRLKRLPIHGGSLRLYVEKKENVDATVTAHLRDEQDRGVDTYKYYENFAERVNNLRDSLMEMLEEIKRRGQTIVGYGAAAKGNTLMHYCGIGKKHLEYIADISKFKHGKFMSGNHLPIVPPEKLLEDQPDYVLLLVWNFAEDVIKAQAEYLSKGGNFIIPIPEPRVVGEVSMVHSCGVPSICSTI